MDFMSFMNGMKGDFLRQKLIQAGISPNDMQGIDFNNINDLNRLAEKVMPNIIKSNPSIASMIKSNASMLWTEKAKEVCEVIDVD